MLLQSEYYQIANERLIIFDVIHNSRQSEGVKIFKSLKHVKGLEFQKKKKQN